MMSRFQPRFMVSLMVLAFIACSDSATSPPANAQLSATIDGVAWTSTTSHVTYQNPAFLLSGAGALAGTATVRGLSIGVAAITAPGTYPIFSATSNAIISNANLSQVWSTNAVGGTGTITVIDINAGHFSGTFSFDAVGQEGGATGTMHVTNGKFDLTF